MEVEGAGFELKGVSERAVAADAAGKHESEDLSADGVAETSKQGGFGGGFLFNGNDWCARFLLFGCVHGLIEGVCPENCLGN